MVTSNILILKKFPMMLQMIRPLKVKYNKHGRSPSKFSSTEEKIFFPINNILVLRDGPAVLVLYRIENRVAPMVDPQGGVGKCLLQLQSKGKVLNSLSGPLTPMCRISGDISSRFQSQSRWPYLHFVRGRHEPSTNLLTTRSTNSKIHLWCYTCCPFDVQYCSQLLPHMYQQRWELFRI